MPKEIYKIKKRRLGRRRDQSAVVLTPLLTDSPVSCPSKKREPLSIRKEKKRYSLNKQQRQKKSSFC